MNEKAAAKRLMNSAVRAAVIAAVVSIGLAIAGLRFGDDLGSAKGYILFFGPMLLGYAIGRVHEAARRSQSVGVSS
jgi:hypothetical protein